ncbi:MAG: hypothetical protein H0W33_00900 [Gammaproteobacteria bacterium]|nr:hypothetical protein [Gammaproteobacteria bacterium]
MSQLFQLFQLLREFVVEDQGRRMGAAYPKRSWHWRPADVADAGLAA